MRVKICGITSIEDAFIAVDAGADALGFVFYEKSPRYITIEQAKDITKQLPPFVERVALFVNKTAKEVDYICQKSGMSMAQIHFDVDQSYFRALNIKPLPVIRASSPKDILKHESCYRIVDAYSEDYGGTGKRLNLEWFKGVDCSKIILAGGLNIQNIQETFKYGFYGVDVSSGVEVKKGKKDPEKVKKFIETVKEGKCVR